MNFFTNLLDTLRMRFRDGVTNDGQRDYYDLFGYPRCVGINDFRAKYARGDISGRIVDAYPDACWLYPPLAVEDEKKQDLTPWEKEVEDLFKELKLWQAIHKLDVLCQLGKHAVLFIGLPGNVSLPPKKKLKPLFLMPLAEDVASVHAKDTNPNSPRFGLPVSYKISVEGTPNLIVHYSRVIHVAERTVDNPLIGQSILERIFNRILDLEKVVGSSAEIWWLNGRGGLALESDSDTTIEQPDAEAMTEAVAAYQHGITRWLKLQGVTAKPINHAIPSPKDNFEILISIISGACAIPQRILLGSERGELASGQDETNWNNRISERRTKFCEPVVIGPFLDRLIELEIIGKPKDEVYVWEWPELNKISPKDQAEISGKVASAISTYANSPEADMIITPQQFVEEVLKMEYREDEIKKLLEEERKQMDEDIANGLDPLTGLPKEEEPEPAFPAK